MIGANDILTDEDVAILAKMEVATLQRKMRNGFAKGELDFAQARPMMVGRSRRWVRSDVEAVIKERKVAK